MGAPYRAAEQGGMALADTGRAVAGLGGEMLQEQDRLDIAKAKSDFLKSKIEADNTIETNPDVTTWGKSYEKTLGQATKVAADGIKNNQARALFMEQAGQEATRGLDAVKTLAGKRQRVAAEASLLETIDTNWRSAVASDDEPTRTGLIRSTQDAITAAQNSGIIDPVKAFKMRREFTEKYVGASVLDWYRKQPDRLQAAENLYNGRFGNAQDVSEYSSPAMASATRDLNLSPQEQALYQTHLRNLATAPVNNKDGSTSTLKQISFEAGGRTYNAPTIWDGKEHQAKEAIDHARKIGFDNFPSYGSPQEAEARYSKMHAYMEKDSAAAVSTKSGNLESMWKMLPPDYQTRIFQQAVENQSKLIAIGNAERDTAKAQEKAAADQRVKDFFFNPQVSQDDRANSINWARTSPYVTAETVNKMDGFVRAGGRDFGQNDDRDLLVIESAVRSGEIKSDTDALKYWGDHDLHISYDTLRTRILPMVEAKKDDRFNEALKWGQSELGIPTGAGVLGDLFKDPVNKASALESELRLYRERDPNGDFWGRARETVDRLKKQGNSGAMSALPVVTQAYRDAISSGDARKISDSRSALIAVMQQGGLIDPLKASAKDFDPLSLIDKAQ